MFALERNGVNMKLRMKSATMASTSRRASLSRRGATRITTRRDARSRRIIIKSILVPIDFSAESEKALAYAVPLARRLGAKIILLYVLEPVRTPDFAMFPLSLDRKQLMAKCQRRLRRIASDLRIGSTLLQSAVVRFGAAFQEITHLARTRRVDLILISTHGYTGLKHAVLGSTAERVVRHAPCAVLVVRPREREFIRSEIE